ncbi:hypothetical protein GCM10022239_11470 [Leifsonia bigeumensis]|uniref:Uncharacterized protein n=1 Tax=Leifsonella bigeumensis TaxID=433643 RepID=A0ABP7FH03_9MICO
MKRKKPKPVQQFPVMDGGGPAPREEQIAGIVAMVWSDAHVYHQDVEKLLREWLDTEQCIVKDEEFAILLSKAHGEFARVASTDGTDGPSCPAYALVECLYRDVEQLERASS